MSGPREIIEALTRRGSAALVVDHLAARGPSSVEDVSRAHRITRPNARALLTMLRASGAADLEHPDFRVIAGIRAYRYYLDPDALHYAARWIDALAERAERANRAAAVVPVPRGRSRSR